MQPATVVVRTEQAGGGCCSCAIKCLGATEIVFGVLILVAGIAAVAKTPATDPESLQLRGINYRVEDIPVYQFMNSAPGIWCGIFLIITGVLGVLIDVGSSSKNMYIVNMVFAILSSLLTIACMILAGVAIVAVVFVPDGIITAALHGITIALAFVAMIISMVHACACCQGACSDPVTTQQVVVAQVPAQGVVNPAITMQEYPQAPNENPPLYPDPNIEKA